LQQDDEFASITEMHCSGASCALVSLCSDLL